MVVPSTSLLERALSTLFEPLYHDGWEGWVCGAGIRDVVWLVVTVQLLGVFAVAETMQTD